jgi:hypothetical protein
LIFRIEDFKFLVVICDTLFSLQVRIDWRMKEMKGLFHFLRLTFHGQWAIPFQSRIFLGSWNQFLAPLRDLSFGLCGRKKSETSCHKNLWIPLNLD